MIGRVIARAGAFHEAMAAASAAAPRETGGILLGHRLAADVVVERALEIPDPSATSSSYVRSHARAQSALNLELRRPDAPRQRGYVGEWHSHPAPCDASRQDKREVVEISRLSSGPVLLVVLQRNHKGHWDLTAWIAVAGSTGVAQVEVAAP